MPGLVRMQSDSCQDSNFTFPSICALCMLLHYLFTKDLFQLVKDNCQVFGEIGKVQTVISTSQSLRL